MNRKICIYCGGYNLIADRSLGGKIICKNCGSSSFRNKGFSITKNKKYLLIIIFLTVLLIVIL